MRPRSIAALLLVVAAGVAACSSAGAPRQTVAGALAAPSAALAAAQSAAAPAGGVAAPGGGGPGFSGTACSLLTPDQVGSAMGVKMANGAAIGTKACVWTPSGAPQIGAKQVTLTLIPVNLFNLSRTTDTGIAKTPVSGVGDTAFSMVDTGLPSILSVQKGGTAFTLSISSGGAMTADQEEAIARTLAGEVIAHL